MLSDYLAHDAIGLANLVRTREASARELLDIAIARAEAVNPAINAIVLKDYETARERASRDDARALGDGPFAGVPYLIKDLGAPVAGLRMSMGSRHYRHFVPTEDAPVVALARAAGLNIFAKTNTPELGQMPYTEPELFGPCRNPWSLDHTPGGSSGGAGAAVAAGIVPLAHASDGGGSIRIPASCCGLFGLKPSRGLVPSLHAPAVGELGVDHAISRSVRDSALLLDLMTAQTQHEPVGAPGTFLGAVSEPCQPLDDCLYVTEPMLAPTLIRRRTRGARRRGETRVIARPPRGTGLARHRFRSGPPRVPDAVFGHRSRHGARRGSHHRSQTEARRVRNRDVGHGANRPQARRTRVACRARRTTLPASPREADRSVVALRRDPVR